MKKIMFIMACALASQTAISQLPILQWAKSVSGAGYNSNLAVATDAAGNVYTSGMFSDTIDADPGPGTYTLAAEGLYDGLISKFDAAGNFIWAKHYGGPQTVDGGSFTLDASGNICVTGSFEGTVDFDPGPGTYTLDAISGNPFVLKLDNAGNFLWAKDFEADNWTTGQDIATDAQGNIYTTGFYNGSLIIDANTSFAAFMHAQSYVLKLSPAGNVIWAKSTEEPSSNGGDCISTTLASDATGNVYISGSYTGDVDFNPGSPQFVLSAITQTGMTGSITYTTYNAASFVLKLDLNGNFGWATAVNTPTYAGVTSICLDASNHVYTTGQFIGTADFNPGAATANLTSGLDGNMFVTKSDTAGNFIWAKTIGGSQPGDFTYGDAVATDAAGNVYVSGTFSGTCDFDPGAGTYTLSTIDSNVVFITKLTSSGNSVWAGKIESTYGAALHLDVAGNLYLAGGFINTANFNPFGTPYPLSSAGDADGFVCKLSQPGTVGLKENSLFNSFSVYPNPGNGLFRIKDLSPATNSSIEVYNSMGLLIHQQSAAQENEIDLTAEADGLYFVKVIQDNKIVATYKLVKE